jgi:flagellar hook-basal body complex protein FliE
MKIGFAPAAAAYAKALKAAAPAAEAAKAAASTPSFGQLAQQAATHSIESLRAGERASLQAAAGKADLTQVVTAVSNAEVTLQAAVAVRDRVIQAYLDVLRMPI